MVDVMRLLSESAECSPGDIPSTSSQPPPIEPVTFLSPTSHIDVIPLTESPVRQCKRNHCDLEENASSKISSLARPAKKRKVAKPKHNRSRAMNTQTLSHAPSLPHLPTPHTSYPPPLTSFHPASLSGGYPSHTPSNRPELMLSRMVHPLDGTTRGSFTPSNFDSQPSYNYPSIAYPIPHFNSFAPFPAVAPYYTLLNSSLDPNAQMIQRYVGNTTSLPYPELHYQNNVIAPSPHPVYSTSFRRNPDPYGVPMFQHPFVPPEFVQGSSIAVPQLLHSSFLPPVDPYALRKASWTPDPYITHSIPLRDSASPFEQKPIIRSEEAGVRSSIPLPAHPDVPGCMPTLTSKAKGKSKTRSNKRSVVSGDSNQPQPSTSVSEDPTNLSRIENKSTFKWKTFTPAGLAPASKVPSAEHPSPSIASSSSTQTQCRSRLNVSKSSKNPSHHVGQAF
ncbi:hypothetical protein BDY19DRAFT_934001 [Irpex rosettiformis]|uniref:Uncharacterized protein n=1 Tax=Irpex rosettiformis TaxID=378272 RepID=A0ACB8UAY9_9APHY|nr:hypothetical protein BDY19DRAFT_934001 [Irpex rosettiformis]